MGLNDYPKLKKLFYELDAEGIKILDESASLKSDRERLRKKIAPLEVSLRELNKKINEIERPRLAKIME